MAKVPNGCVVGGQQLLMPLSLQSNVLELLCFGLFKGGLKGTNGRKEYWSK